MKSFILLTLVFSTTLSSIADAGLKIYYIRHAEGGHNVTKAWEAKGIPESEWPSYVGDADVFTPKGLKEVVTGTEKLQQYQFDFVATSPMWRARNTVIPYLKAAKKKGEVWPELREGFGMQIVLNEDIPQVKEDILNKGHLISLPEDEAEFLTLREDGKNNYGKHPKDSSDNVRAAYTKKAAQHAIQLLEKRFGGSDQSILLAGHNSSGVSLLKLLLKEAPSGKAARGLDNVGIWMVEQQEDGSYQLKMYNDKPYEEKE